MIFTVLYPGIPLNNPNNIYRPLRTNFGRSQIQQRVPCLVSGKTDKAQWEPNVHITKNHKIDQMCEMKLLTAGQLL